MDARTEAAAEAFWKHAGKPWHALSPNGRARACAHMESALAAADAAQAPDLRQLAGIAQRLRDSLGLIRPLVLRIIAADEEEAMNEAIADFDERIW